MSYQTMEVDLENGHVRPRGAENLPAKAHALLTIIESEESPMIGLPGGALSDRVRHLAGIGHGKHADLSTNKAHLDDFGR